MGGRHQLTFHAVLLAAAQPFRRFAVSPRHLVFALELGRRNSIL